MPWNTAKKPRFWDLEIEQKHREKRGFGHLKKGQKHRENGSFVNRKISKKHREKTDFERSQTHKCRERGRFWQLTMRKIRTKRFFGGVKQNSKMPRKPCFGFRILEISRVGIVYFWASRTQFCVPSKGGGVTDFWKLGTQNWVRTWGGQDPRTPRVRNGSWTVPHGWTALQFLDVCLHFVWSIGWNGNKPQSP